MTLPASTVGTSARHGWPLPPGVPCLAGRSPWGLHRPRGDAPLSSMLSLSSPPFFVLAWLEEESAAPGCGVPVATGERSERGRERRAHAPGRGGRQTGASAARRLACVARRRAVPW